MNTRVLVVDDEQDTLNLLRTILEISGYVPITTLNSVDAVGLAEVEKPDVVLLDIMMPKLDGFTLCKMMRANSATQALPIIFVTAYESLDIEERRAEAGANKVINKPINMDVLIKAIDEVLKNPIPPVGKLSGESDGKTTKTQESAKVKQDSQPQKDKDNGKGKDNK